MFKIIDAILLTVFMLLLIMQSSAQLLKYNSKDSIGDQPKFEAALTGSIRLNGVFDLKGDLHGNSSFLIHQNSINGHDRSGLWIDLRQSHLCLEGKYRLANGKEVLTVLDADFEAGPDNRSTFRLRQAYLQYGGLLVGQAWSAFGDAELWPSGLVDWDGPTGLVNSRRPQIRYTIGYTARLEGDISAELMEPRRLYDYTIPDGANTIHYEPRRLPDLVGSLKYKFEPGFVKIAGIYRHIDYGYLDEHKVANGYGLSAMLKVMTGSQKKNPFLLQLNYGTGIADYILPMGGSKLDGNVSRDDKSKLNLLPTLSGMATYQQFWSTKLYSLFVFSMSDFDSKKADFEWDRMTNIYASTNLMYSILPNCNTGVEFLWGRKTLEFTDIKEHAVASRVNFGFVYNF